MSSNEPLHSPRIDRIEVVRSGKVRRAKLYYLRGRTGRAARIKERRRPQRTVTPVARSVEPLAAIEPQVDEVETLDMTDETDLTES